MAHVWIDDLWLKSDNGVPPTAKVRQILASSHSPQTAKVPDRWKSARFGKGKRWRCRWYTFEDGRYRQHSKSFVKHSEAEAFQADMENDIRLGHYINPHDQLRSFESVSDQWLASKNRVSEDIKARYACLLQAYVNPKWSGVPIGAISHNDVASWVHELSTGTYPAVLRWSETPRPLAPRTIKTIVKTIFSGVMEYAVRLRYLNENPAKDVEIPKPEYRDLVFLNIQEIERLADAASIVGRPVDGLIIRFQSYVGTRINETFAIQIRDMDLVNREIRIRHAWKNSAKAQRLGTPKNGRARTVAIPTFLVNPLMELTKDHLDTDYVFRGTRGGHINDHHWRRRVWNPAVKLAGLQNVEGLTPHTLRHSYAAIAIRAGADIKVIQRQMGHASASMTLDIYGFLFPNQLAQVANAIDLERANTLANNK